MMLKADPIGKDDPPYFTAEDTPLTIGSRIQPCCVWDSDGTLIYLPKLGFRGVEMSIYDMSDGADNSGRVLLMVDQGS